MRTISKILFTIRANEEGRMCPEVTLVDTESMEFDDPFERGMAEAYFAVFRGIAAFMFKRVQNGALTQFIDAVRNTNQAVCPFACDECHYEDTVEKEGHGCGTSSDSMLAMLAKRFNLTDDELRQVIADNVSDEGVVKLSPDAVDKSLSKDVPSEFTDFINSLKMD